MAALLQLYFHQFLIFMLVLTRMSTLVMTLPAIGGNGVPMQVKALLAVSIALLITPLHWGVEVQPPENLAALAGLLAKEALLGLAVGLSLHLLVAAMQLAGQIIGQVSGLSLADVFDPTFEDNISIYAQFLETTAVAVFFVVGGHRKLIDALAVSFHWMPPGQGHLPPDLPEALADIAGRSFEVALRASAPIMLALLLATLIVAVISRTLPQLNSIAVGLNFNSLVVLAATATCIGSAAWVFQDEIGPALNRVTSVFDQSADAAANMPGRRYGQ